MFRRVASLLGLLVALGLSEAAARIYLCQSGRQYEQLRAHLAGESHQQSRIVGVPYRLYEPAPNYRSGRNSHNEQAYRGRAVSMQRDDGVARVLCLGGSTTYGTSVEDPEDAYPAQLEAILTEIKPTHVTGVEVINGGLEYATTAELLTHYHFKFHYYQPDLVVINTGGNDALPAQFPDYHPDYTHWREQPRIPRALAQPGRILLKSRLMALGLILLLHGDADRHLALDRNDGPPDAEWYPEDGDGASVATAPAFEHNLSTLADQALSDGAGVLLVPCRLAPGDDVPEAYYVHSNERALFRVAEERGLSVAPFPADVISPECWRDGSHLNEAGCRQKAAHIAQCAAAALWSEHGELGGE